MRISNNITAANSHRQLSINTERQSKTVEKLSSGFRINRSADDAAGLAISEKMRTQIRGLNQASRNTQDGISLVQTADGGMQTITNMLQRKRELMVQALNGTNDELDRGTIQLELNQLMQEIHDTATTLDFNGLNILSRAGGNTFTFEPLVPSHFPAGTVLLGGAPVSGIPRPTSAGGSLSTQVTNPNTGELFGLVDFTSRVSDGWQMGDSIDLNIELAFDVPVARTRGPFGVPGSHWFIHEFDFPNVITITTPSHHQTGISETLTYVWDGLDEFRLTPLPTGALRHFDFPVSLPAHSESRHNLEQSIRIPISGVFHHIGPPVPDHIDESLNNYNLRDFDGAWSFQVIHGETTGYPARMDSFNFSQESTMVLVPQEPIWIQSGANAGVGINITGVDARPFSLGLKNIWGDTLVVTDPHEQAEEALVLITEAINELNLMRAEMGAQNNRLEYTLSNVNNTSENLSAAESRIRDADMAEKMTLFTRDSILTQASTAMLAQANALPQAVLQLLG